MKDHPMAIHKLGDPTRELDLDRDRARRFEDLFDRHAGRVYAYAARRSTPDAANDVVGETFLIAWRKLDALPADPLPWLLNVAGKVLANRRRSAQRRDAFTAELARTIRASPSIDPADALHTRMAIEDALGRLPPTEKEALTLVAWDGLDIGAAAAAAGCSRATFSVRLHRARRRVMKELGLSRHSRAKGTSQARAQTKEPKPT
jgi:RNA polymerase sigma-70 factor, ECF subfamily